MPKTLNHYSTFAFKDAFWALPAEQRAAFYPEWCEELRDVAPRADFYQVFPTRSDTDALLWCALPLADDAGPGEQGAFFERLARTIYARRRWIQPGLTLWGFTRPSQYARGQSTQEIDPFSPERKPYLIVYPFTKTAEWYLLSRDTRQGMMNQHIRIGHQYPEIKQLLLYSFGLQEQEFVVVYEADDLTQFSDLVNELRSSEARRYTLRDTPIFTAQYRAPQELAALVGV